MRKSLTAAGLVLGICLIASPSLGSEFKVVTPPDWANKAGDGYTAGFPDGFRLQQLMPAQWFDGRPDSMNMISQVAFRPATLVDGPMDSPIGKLTVRLSTTSRQPGELSLTYAQNAGPDELVVFEGETSVTTQNQLSTNGVTKDFDMLLPFTHLFAYDPSQGNLLVDIMVEPTADVLQIPDIFSDFAFADTGNLVGIHEVAHNAGPEAGPPTALTGNASYIGGNILEMTFVPEPTTVSMLAFAMLVGGIASHRLCRGSRNRI